MTSNEQPTTPPPAPAETTTSPAPTKPDADETTPTDVKHDPDAPRNDVKPDEKPEEKPDEKPAPPPPATTNGVAVLKARARTPEPDEEVDWEEGEIEDDGNESDFEIETEQRTSTPPVDDDSVQFNVGCGIPCRFYNHDRCTRGAACGYLHGPDDKSVRDTNGKNVCRYFLLGDCKFGIPKCAYSHKKDHLPAGGWWESEAGIEEEKARVEEEKRAAKDAWKEQQRAERATRRRQQQQQQQQQQQHQHQQNNQRRRGGGNAGGPGRSRNHVGPFAQLNVAPQPGSSHATMQQAMSVAELADRMQNFGFTERQLLDLAAYGVKPWDEGAWTTLNMLYHY